MKEHDIRDLRIERALTQSELAELVGCAQSTISMIESGTYQPSGLLLSRIASALTLRSQPKRNEQLQFDFVFPTIRYRGSLPIQIDSWKRPEVSGDFYLVLPTSDKSVLIIAIDIAGHGSTAFPSAVHLAGWIKGHIGKSPNLVRLDVLAQEIGEVAEEFGISLSCYLGQFTRIVGRKHTISYEGVSCGFPSPLLLSGLPVKTLESAYLNSSLPMYISREIEVISHEISAPWQLVVSTDGLLARLGAGGEVDGKRKLLKLITSNKRERIPANIMRADIPPADDELLIVAKWDSWDRVSMFDLDDMMSLHFFYDIAEKMASELLGQDAAMRLIQATIEAVDNARRHAYHGDSGLVTMRFRSTPDSFCIEVEDGGKNNIPQTEVLRSPNGFAVIRTYVDNVDVRQANSGGTIVTLITKIPKAKENRTNG